MSLIFFKRHIVNLIRNKVVDHEKRITALEKSLPSYAKGPPVWCPSCNTNLTTDGTVIATGTISSDGGEFKTSYVKCNECGDCKIWINVVEDKAPTMFDEIIDVFMGSDGELVDGLTWKWSNGKAYHKDEYSILRG